MEAIPLSWLFGTLVVLLLTSAFFSIAETSMMALNRYRLSHMAKQGKKSALMTQRLLATTDRLLGVILLGNNLVNSASAVLTAIIAERLLGKDEYVLAVATGAVTFLILVFSEITPKVIGSRFPERIALPASYVLTPLLKITYPVVWFVNLFVQLLLKVLRIQPPEEGQSQLSMEELRTLVLEGGQFIPKKHQNIMVNLFDLESMTVDDTMTPRALIEGVDINDRIEDIRNNLATAHHTRVIVYDGDLSNVIGLVHVRKVLNASRKEPLEKGTLREIMREPYFIPEGTPLLQQLTLFQENQRRMALVVDEYGEIQGLVTLQDILEEIVGEFTSQSPMNTGLYRRQDDGSVMVEGSCPLRVLNRKLGFNFPLEGPKTINGLLLEHLEDIPEPGSAVKIADYPIEILQVQDKMVKVVRLELPVPARN
ncbi:MAG: HlyC/CorC family transporter [Betaproteobacteria bacterium]|nr:HlyC/CorC family transporter [Betaproteobacteria bacterium]